jgi:hypothetical protein
MKSLYLRSGLALLCAATLAACGGSGGSLALQASITGLTKTGLILTNGKDTVTVDAGTGVIQFPTLVAQDEQFDIEMKQQPTGAVCTITNNKNKANYYTVQQTLVSCVTNSYTLGGNISGLKASGLVLANGADTVSVAPPATPGASVSFAFPTKVADGAPFGVTVLAQPKNTDGTPAGTCVVSNNTGTMPSGDALGLIVTCN